jgi:uncharacterized protein YciI
LYFALVAHDRPNAVADRQRLRPEHLKHLDSLGETLIFAGPFLNDQGEGVGSIVVIEAEDLAAARMAFAHDPFVREGLFDSVTIKPWKLTINKVPH